MQIISASIDLSKIDKSKIIEGKKGKYYNIDIIIHDTPNQYGKDVAVCEPQTREQRDAKVQRTFLGNGKTVFKSKQEQNNLDIWQVPDKDPMPF